MMHESAKSKWLMGIWCSSLAYFILLISLVVYSYNAVTDAKTQEAVKPTEVEGDENVPCSRNFFAYRECTGAIHDVLGITPQEDNVFEHMQITVWVLLWALAVLAVAATGMIYECTERDGRFWLKTIVHLYLICYIGIAFSLAYYSWTQPRFINTIIGDSGTQEYGPFRFNDTDTQFSLTNHPPPGVDSNTKAVFEAILSKNEPVISYAVIEQLRAHCSDSWIDQKCQVAGGFGLCGADLQINEAQCSGTNLLLEWNTLSFLLRYWIPISVLVNWAAITLVLTGCLGLNCCIPSSDSNGSVPVPQRCREQRLGREPRQRNKQNQRIKSSLEARINRIQEKRKREGMSIDDRVVALELPSIDEDTETDQVLVQVGEICCICYDAPVEIRCVNCHTQCICRRCRDRLFEYSGDATRNRTYGRCPLCRNRLDLHEDEPSE
eukprot:gb/GECG01008703.1/.p1 GENE.gb/GECG01008703.1/~~gb/GECG01008703.1/.p1  ORF type:complete len:437 (+),score=26.81 gb/GECG01008703.1/:1-1311(+)